MNQLFKDLITLLQKDRKTQFIVGGIVALVVIGFMLNSNQRRIVVRKSKPTQTSGSRGLANEEAYNDVLTAFKNNMEETQRTLAETRSEVSDIQKHNKESEERITEILKRVITRISESESQGNYGPAGSTPEFANVNMGGASLFPGASADGRDMTDKILAAGGVAIPGTDKFRMPDGTIVDKYGRRYDANGNPIKANMLMNGQNQDLSGKILSSGGMPIPGTDRFRMPDGTIVDRNGRRLNGNGQPTGASLFTDDQYAEADQLESIGNETVEPVPSIAPKERLAVVGAGDSVRIKLLAGVDAPTDGTPYPVVFKLVSDIYGPDGSTLPLGEARLIAAAQGSLSDARALFRLSSINLRLPDGRRKVFPVDGWVVGEDGIRGMEGILIDPLGKAIAGAAIGGGISGLGNAISETQVTRTTNGLYGSNTAMVTGSDGKYALGRALEGAANQYTSIINERLQMLVPHVQVLSGREATAVFSKSFTISDLYNALQDDNSHFASLD